MCLLRKANREVIRALERPPDRGEERALDRIAAELWELAQRDDGPDVGRLCRLRHDLAALAERTHDHRREHVLRAREALGEYAAERRPSGAADSVAERD